jgi:ribosomal protein L37AE/L43A
MATKKKEHAPIDFTRLESCPKCETSWQGKPIPEDQQDLYGGEKWFSRVIGLYDVRRDGIIAWRCPDCGTTWDRFTSKIIPSPAKP